MYTFDSRIRYSETDEYSSLTVPALIDYFQDCSSFQSIASIIKFKILFDNIVNGIL